MVLYYNYLLINIDILPLHKLPFYCVRFDKQTIQNEGQVIVAEGLSYCCNIGGKGREVGCKGKISEPKELYLER